MKEIIILLLIIFLILTLIITYSCLVMAGRWDDIDEESIQKYMDSVFKTGNETKVETNETNETK